MYINFLVIYWLLKLYNNLIQIIIDFQSELSFFTFLFLNNQNILSNFYCCLYSETLFLTYVFSGLSFLLKNHYFSLIIQLIYNIWIIHLIFLVYLFTRM